MTHIGECQFCSEMRALLREAELANRMLRVERDTARTALTQFTECLFPVVEALKHIAGDETVGRASGSLASKSLVLIEEALRKVKP